VPSDTPAIMLAGLGLGFQARSHPSKKAREATLEAPRCCSSMQGRGPAELGIGEP